ncbi:hypothetical protein ACKKBF_B05640 [Auxenochlorella protothecoides x Auxenochlorella symbiontica]
MSDAEEVAHDGGAAPPLPDAQAPPSDEHPPAPGDAVDGVSPGNGASPPPLPSTGPSDPLSPKDDGKQVERGRSSSHDRHKSRRHSSRDKSRERRRRSRSRDKDRRRRSRSREARRRSQSRDRDRRRRRSTSRSRRHSRSPRRHSRSRRRRSPSVVITRAPIYEVERVAPPSLAALPALNPLALPMAGNMPLATDPYKLIPNLGMPAAPPPPATNQATRPQRRLYVGGLPTPCYDFQLTAFLNQALVASGICSPPPGRMPIIGCQLTQEKGFAFIEFAEIADCTAAVQLDGIPYMGSVLKIKRPKEYLALPYTTPDPPAMGAAVLANFLAQSQALAGGAAPAAAAPLPTQPPPPQPTAGNIWP